MSLVYYDSVEHSPKNFDLALLFAALSDPTRLRLLNLMYGREVCVCYFVEILGQSQPKISRHLAYLRRAGVVTARREGKWMHYRIERPGDEAAAANKLRSAILNSKWVRMKQPPHLPRNGFSNKRKGWARRGNLRKKNGKFVDIPCHEVIALNAAP